MAPCMFVEACCTLCLRPCLVGAISGVRKLIPPSCPTKQCPIDPEAVEPKPTAASQTCHLDPAALQATLPLPLLLPPPPPAPPFPPPPPICADLAPKARATAAARSSLNAAPALLRFSSMLSPPRLYILAANACTWGEERMGF